MKLGYFLGKEIIKLHDQEGMPSDLSLGIASERGLPVALLGILIEANRRHLSVRLQKEIAEEWAKLFTPTETENKVLAYMRQSCPT